MRRMRSAMLGRVLAVGLLAAGGCTPGGSEPETTPPPPESEGCGADQLGAYVGQPASDEVISRIREWRGDNPIRVLKPGSAMTMDYRPGRLNIFLDDKDRIKEFKCN